MTDPANAPEISVGDPAPDFSLPRDGGGALSLSELKGKPVVLYFYPRDDTPGCTTEALDFTALGAEFAAAGAVVLGVSKGAGGSSAFAAGLSSSGVDMSATTRVRYR